MKANIITVAALFFIPTIATAQLQEERYQNTQSPNNSIENAESYSQYDVYKIAKAKNALVYGRDYIFEGFSASDVDSALINLVDPYSYLNQFRDYENVTVHVEDSSLNLNINLILFARMKRATSPLSETE